MKAVGYKAPGPVDVLQDIVLEQPQAAGRDLLVRIHAVSVNPVDAKLRVRAGPDAGQEWKVLGFDASGVVEAAGADVQSFEVGDPVFYSGSLSRQGTNSEYQLVDERIVGRRPASLGHAEAAALPLTAITAWEMLFDRLCVQQPPAQGGDVILVIGGAGGVGSIAIQLLRQLTDLTVIATASRPQTQAWVRECGAHHVIDHSLPLAAQVARVNLGAPGFVFSITQTDRHMADIVELIAPQGRFGLIDDPRGGLDVMPFKRKSVSIHWEFMFARPLFNTPDVVQQGRLLNELSGLVDAQRVRSTMTQVMGRIDAATVRAAHAQIESGTTRGKIVLEGF